MEEEIDYRSMAEVQLKYELKNWRNRFSISPGIRCLPVLPALQGNSP